MSYFEKCLSTNPPKQTYRNIAECYRRIGKYKKAIEWIKKGLESIESKEKMDFIRQQYALEYGICLRKLGKPSEGLEKLQLAYELAEETTRQSMRNFDEAAIDKQLEEGSSRNEIILQQFMCKRLMLDATDPDFNQLFIRFCTSYESLQVLHDALDRANDQELTRTFLDFFKSYAKNEYFPLRFLNQNRTKILMFRNSALVTDYFRHIIERKRRK